MLSLWRTQGSPIRCVGERITATGVPEFREVAWRACGAYVPTPCWVGTR
ncbi:hypothetical protein [Bathymodiolus japonicus methanotrophic gill symbiont]|nr:hypothetical protein [Bathymodiolus japonicus methanotrophic gill symbiont]